MRDFLPGWWPTLVVALLLPLLIGLGLWQLQRADEKTALLASFDARRSAAPLAVAELEQQADPAYRRVRLQGHFDANHSLLLDNRTRAGRVGVELLQPFYDQASGLWVLVNRGWLPWPDRRTPVSFVTPEASLTLTAWAYVPPGTVFQLQLDPVASEWPRLVTRIEAPLLWQQLGRGGLPYELRLDAGPASFLVDWPVVAMGPEKHLGYAVQWFALALALAGLFVYLSWHTYKEKRVQQSAGELS
ncbi:MAG: SURF1 family protein [Pseudomonas sp.]|uniref:SURF1 family protein n=1 Tax=Pseudomonas sp. TaxID=306 RepID=UPI0033909A26